jgi:type I restriction enzyme S subunit
MQSEAKGTTQKFVGLGYLRNYLVQIPPLEEQKQIVAVLDKAFAAIDLAKANIEKNLQNAKELFQSKLNGIFTQKGEGWEEKTLGETCVVERGSSPRPIKQYQTEDENGVNWIKIGDTKGVEKYIYSTKERITKEGSLKSRFVDIGDFILSNSMSFGRPYIMKTQGYIHDGWFVLRLPESINTEFFWYLLASPYTKNQFESLAAGAIVKNISGDLVKKAKLPVPPLVEQEKIVIQMDLLSSKTKKLEAKYFKEHENLDELKKSILQKAFAGKLIIK